MRPVKRAQIPAVKKPVGLSNDGKRPEWANLMLWSRRKPLALNVTVPDTFAQSYLYDTTIRFGASADTAASNKTQKCHALFVPLAVETGSRNLQAVQFVENLEKRIPESQRIRWRHSIELF